MNIYLITVKTQLMENITDWKVCRDMVTDTSGHGMAHDDDDVQSRGSYFYMMTDPQMNFQMFLHPLL